VQGVHGRFDVQSRLGDLTEGGTEVWASIMQDYGVSVDDLFSKMDEVVDQDAIDHAESWYPDVRQISTDISAETGIGEDRIIAAYGACSPKCVWKSEKDGEGEEKYVQEMARWVAAGNADRYPLNAKGFPEEAMMAWKAEYKANNTVRTLKGEPKGAQLMNTTGMRGMAVLMGAKEPDDVLNDNKTRSFFNNISDPGGTDDVTIDTHMTKTLEMTYGVSHTDALKFIKKTGGTVKKDNRVLGAGYLAVSEAVRQIALKYDVTPDVAQAAFWEQVQFRPVISDEDGKDWPGGVPRTEPE